MDLITALSPRVQWHEVVRTIVDRKLAIVLAAVLDGGRPDGGVVGHPVAERPAADMNEMMKASEQRRRQNTAR